MARAALTTDDIAAFRARAAEVATRMFADDGYDGLSMRALAAELGVSPMTPYRYFANKDDLFALVRTEAFRRFADRQAEAARTHAGAQRLRALGAAYIQFAIDEPQAYRIMFQLEQSAVDAYPELEAEQKRALSYLLDAVTQAIEAGRLEGDALTKAHLLWAQVHGLVSLHLAGKLIMGRTFAELYATPEIAGDPT